MPCLTPLSPVANWPMEVEFDSAVELDAALATSWLSCKAAMREDIVSVVVGFVIPRRVCMMWNRDLSRSW